MNLETEEMHEWIVVSDCLVRPDEAHEAVEILTPAEFSQPGARDTFTAIRDLHVAGQPADIVGVMESLERSGKLTRPLADRLREAGLQERCATPIKFYADKVLQHAKRRQAREIVSEAHNHLCNGHSLDDALSGLFDKLGPLTTESSGPRRRSNDGFEPFPLDALPGAVRSFVRAVARAIGCDPVFVILPLLAAAAGAIGNSRRLTIKRGWSVPAILWCVSVGESGQQKSPPLRVVMRPFWRRQQELREEYSASMAAFKDDQRAYKAAVKQMEKTGNGDLPEQPQPPPKQKCVVVDVNIEGLATALRDNPRGTLLSRDELSGWIGSFDKYSGRGQASADAGAWLSIYNSEPIDVVRKDSDRDCFVERPTVSVVGSIQPGILNRAIGSEHRENGLLSRLLLAYPARQPKQWSDAEVSQHIEEQYADLIESLFSLQMDSGSDGSLKPAVVSLDDHARQIFKDYCNETGSEQATLTGELAAAWSKLEESAARIALVTHCIRQASGESVDPWICDVDSMTSGVVVARWFKNETRRVYNLLSESQDQRELRQLVEWIKSRGGRVRARDVLNGRRDIETADDAEHLLISLVRSGFGRWEYSGNPRGRTAREFVLFD